MLKAKTRVKMKFFFSKLGNIWIFSKNKISVAERDQRLKIGSGQNKNNIVCR